MYFIIIVIGAGGIVENSESPDKRLIFKKNVRGIRCEIPVDDLWMNVDNFLVYDFCSRSKRDKNHFH